VVGKGKLTKQKPTLRDAYEQFLSLGIRYAFSEIKTTGLAALYYVDVLDEFIPRLDDVLRSRFCDIVRKAAEDHGVCMCVVFVFVCVCLCVCLCGGLTACRSVCVETCVCSCVASTARGDYQVCACAPGSGLEAWVCVCSARLHQ
jgi:hypothetical protein